MSKYSNEYYRASKELNQSKKRFFSFLWLLVISIIVPSIYKSAIKDSFYEDGARVILFLSWFVTIPTFMFMVAAGADWYSLRKKLNEF